MPQTSIQWGCKPQLKGASSLNEWGLNLGADGDLISTERVGNDWVHGACRRVLPNTQIPVKIVWARQ